jgi:hypothetical protein
MKTTTKHLHYPLNLPRLATVEPGSTTKCDTCGISGRIRVDDTAKWVDWTDGHHTILTEELCGEA